MLGKKKFILKQFIIHSLEISIIYSINKYYYILLYLILFHFIAITKIKPYSYWIKIKIDAIALIKI